MKNINCTCEESHYCPDDNLHYPAHACKSCRDAEEEMWNALVEYQTMIDTLSTKYNVKALKLKPKHRVSNNVELIDLPF